MSLAFAVAHRVIAGARFNFSNEAELQEGMARAFRAAEVAFEREVRIGKRDRIDFIVGDSAGEAVGIEVKVDGSLSAVTRQLWRYSQCKRLTELLLVTSRSQLRQLHGTAMNGKRIEVIYLPVAFQ